MFLRCKDSNFFPDLAQFHFLIWRNFTSVFGVWELRIVGASNFFEPKKLLYGKSKKITIFPLKILSLLLL
jgi:hypothetical protein